MQTVVQLVVDFLQGNILAFREHTVHHLVLAVLYLHPFDEGAYHDPPTACNNLNDQPLPYTVEHSLADKFHPCRAPTGTVLHDGARIAHTIGDDGLQPVLVLAFAHLGCFCEHIAQLREESRHVVEIGVHRLFRFSDGIVEHCTVVLHKLVNLGCYMFRNNFREWLQQSLDVFFSCLLRLEHIDIAQRQ